jgi:hypothetical protein
MKNSRIKIQNYLFLLAFLVVLFLPLIALGQGGSYYLDDGTRVDYQGLVPCGKTAPSEGESPEVTIPCQLCHLFVMFQGIVNFLLTTIVPVVAVLMIVIGGLMLMFAHFELIPKGSAGDSALISMAKSLFTYTIVGLIVIYGAWLLINLFFQLIGVADWTGLRERWWQINCPILRNPIPTPSPTQPPGQNPPTNPPTEQNPPTNPPTEQNPPTNPPTEQNPPTNPNQELPAQG